MRLDSADLALLEIDADKLGELAAGIVLMLLARIREDAETVEDAERLCDKARACAKDAQIYLDHLRQYLKEAPIDADREADRIEAELSRIERL